MTTQARPLDLQYRVALAVEYVVNNPDRNRDFRPYFSYQLLDAPVYMLHTFFDAPHVAGRFLDALLRAEAMTGMRADEEVEAGLTRQLFGCIGEDGLGYAEPGYTSPREAIIHDQRELLMGLTGLIVRRQSAQALQAAAKLVRRLWELTGEQGDETGNVPGPALRGDGWAPPSAMEGFRYAPANTGRLATALNQYYLASHDPLALSLSRRFLNYSLRRCFHPDGALKEWAGFHLHSITGTVESLVEFGMLVNESSYIEAGKRILDTGLRPFYSSWGWVKENLANEANDGEANNTGDVMRTALLLGRAGYPEYYETAERMLRNHLLASQLLDVDWIVGREDPTHPDEYDRTYRDIARRARGGFGFTCPNDWVTDQKRKAKRFPLNADIVQGSVQAIVAAWEHAVVQEPAGAKVNLYLTRATDSLAVTSCLPAEGRLVLEARQDGNVLVRLPSWLKGDAVTVMVNQEPQPARVDGIYLCIDRLRAGDQVTLEFPLARRKVEEIVNYRLYRGEWTGDQLTALSPPGELRPLYTS